MVLVHTPVGLGDAARINPVRVVVLSGGLGRCKAGESSNADGECGTHIDGVVRRRLVARWETTKGNEL